ncbi:MAG: hypothetical protein ABSC77_00300 [Terracidiphilus sp.]
MNPRLVVLLLCAPLLAVCARAKTILPDACGDDSVKFEVSTLKNQPAPALRRLARRSSFLCKTRTRVETIFPFTLYAMEWTEYGLAPTTAVHISY